MVDTVEQAETIVAALNRDAWAELSDRPCPGMDFVDQVPDELLPGPVEFTLLTAVPCRACGQWAVDWFLDPAAGVLRHGPVRKPEPPCSCAVPS